MSALSMYSSGSRFKKHPKPNHDNRDIEHGWVQQQ